MGSVLMDAGQKMKPSDLSNLRFGRLTVVERAGSQRGHSLWKCRCDCGTTTLVLATNLKQGKTQSCGCFVIESLKNRTIDLTGNRYGRLVVVRMVGRVNGRTMVDCLCDCGKTSIIWSNALRRGVTTSCGCKWTESITTHGRSSSPEYDCWVSLIARCYNPRTRGYHNYGGRGITVCDRWRGEKGFERFLEDMGNKPSTQHSIDRVDNNGNYDPANCRWATPKEQCGNIRSNVWVEYCGKKMIAGVFADMIGWARPNVYRHLAKGKSPEWIADRAASRHS